MRKLTLILIFFSLFCLFSSVASATPMTITFTGSLNYVDTGDPDVHGLNGATFEWQGVFDSLATRSFTNGSNLDRFSGDISIDITLAGGAGVLSLNSELDTIGENPGGQLQLGSASFFNLGDGQLSAPTLFLNDASILGNIPSPSNTLSPVNTADVSDFGYFGYDEINFSTFETISVLYSVENGAIVTTVVPEPGTALLMGLGLAGLATIRRR